MVTKLEYADAAYYCRIKKELDLEGFKQEHTECNFSPHPDCRRCDVRKANEWVFDKSKR